MKIGRALAPYAFAAALIAGDPASTPSTARPLLPGYARSSVLGAAPSQCATPPGATFSRSMARYVGRPLFELNPPKDRDDDLGDFEGLVPFHLRPRPVEEKWFSISSSGGTIWERKRLSFGFYERVHNRFRFQGQQGYSFPRSLDHKEVSPAGVYGLRRWTGLEFSVQIDLGRK